MTRSIYRPILQIVTRSLSLVRVSLCFPAADPNANALERTSTLELQPMTTAADSPRTSHSLINRITSPFKSKTRNVSDFHIQTAEPHRQYAPGDIVKGSVFLTIHKPVRVTHIVVCLHGYVKVYKNAIAPGDGTARDGGFSRTGPGKRGTEYLGNGFISLFEDEVVLCGDGRLGIGLYTFRFELEFPPSGLPSSIDVSICPHEDSLPTYPSC